MNKSRLVALFSSDVSIIHFFYLAAVRVPGTLRTHALSLSWDTRQTCAHMIDLYIPTHMSTPLPLARGGPAPCMAATNSGAARLCLRPQPPRPTLPARAVPPHTRHRPVITRAAGPGVDSSGQKQGKEGEQGDGTAEDTSSSSPTSTSSLAVAAPDQSAFSNAVVTTFFVWAGGALFGLDPWAAARTEPLGASALAGLACAVPYIGFLAAVRALLGGV